jgi:carbamoyltransferase
MKRVISIYGIKDRNKFEYPAFVHDHNMSIMEDEKLVDYMHLERKSRVKYDNSLDEHIEEILLNESNQKVDSESIMLFVNSFVGNSFISANGRIRFECSKSGEDLLKANKGFCWIQNEKWKGFEVEAYSISHEIAHAFSAVPFAGGLKENSLLISFDGGSSTGNFAAFHYKNKKLIQIESNWELSHLSKIFNDNGLSFGIINARSNEHCSVPGKLMGYASWGKSNPEILNWLNENNFFKDAWGERTDFVSKAKNEFNWKGNLNQNKDNFLFDIAAAMQDTFKIGILDKIQLLAEETGAEFLYYSGGCALNIVANSDIINSNYFKDVYICPCCNDSGLSIGASAYWAFLNNQELESNTPYLNNWECSLEYSYSDSDIIETAEALLKNGIVGICNGAAEVGPRALGNRSIIALANTKTIAEKVSMDIKQREWYRPIAPIMLEQNTKLFTGLDKIHNLSKYMLLDFNILKEYQKEIEGVVHSNGTARIQTIFNKSDNPFIFDLLTYLDEKHKIKALINTSFNGKGEPIVQTAQNAMDSAKNLNLDGIVLNGKYISL